MIYAGASQKSMVAAAPTECRACSLLAQQAHHAEVQHRVLLTSDYATTTAS
jgi:hypothetical protein